MNKKVKITDCLNNGFSSLKIIRSDYFIMATSLLVLFTVFSFCYVRNVVMLQNGWWHYFAWRVNEGDILYKDIYMYIPPYFTLFTSFLYRFFKNSFFDYIIYIGYPMKLLCLYLMYEIICRITKPFYAAVSVLIGACLSASYFMDVWYDYNPVLMAPCLLVAKCMQLYFEKKRMMHMLIVGILIGILLFSKQTLGISFTLAVFLMIILGNNKNDLVFILKSLIVLVVGLIVGLAPGIWYISYHDCWSEFAKCLTLATGAKGGTLGLLSHLKVILFQKKVWIITFLLMPFIFYGKSTWKTVSKYRNVSTFMGILACFVFMHLLHNLNILKTIFKLKNIIILLSFLSTIWVIYKSKMVEMIVKSDTRYLHYIYLGCLMIIIIIWGNISGNYHMYIYNTYHIFGIRRLTIAVLSYVFILIWIKEFYAFIYKKEDNIGLLAFISIIFTHFLVGIISSDRFEELYMILYVPWGLAYLFNTFAPKIYLKNYILLIVSLVCVLSCLSSKMAIPYDWQGWRTPPIQSNDIESKIRGLNGYKMSSVVEEQYSKVVSLLNEYTNENDTVYQFANIPLFNVLAERKIPVYGAISWFDVLPDQIAILDSKLLRKENPKMVIWHKMSEDEWDLLERVFRNGKKSGQREIKKFYDEVILVRYSKVYSFYNNRDGEIEVFLRN